MLFKIFFQAFTLYLFLGGYGLTFIIMIILKFPIFNSFWISFIGGISLCGVWGFCIKLLTFLFSERELAKLFGLPLPEGIADAFNENDDDELTLTDLYNPDDDLLDDSPANEDFIPHITNDILSDTFTPPDRDDSDSSEATTSGRLDINGNFDLTVAGKTLKARPQDGAQAIKKVLHESEDQ